MTPTPDSSLGRFDSGERVFSGSEDWREPARGAALAALKTIPGQVNLSVVSIVIETISMTGPLAMRSVIEATEESSVPAMRALMQRVIGSSAGNPNADRWGAVTVADMIRDTAQETATMFVRYYDGFDHGDKTLFVNSVTAAGVAFYARGMIGAEGFGQIEYDGMTTPWRAVYSSPYLDDAIVPFRPAKNSKGDRSITRKPPKIDHRATDSPVGQDYLFGS